MKERKTKPPETSLEAWRSVTQQMINTHHAQILEALSILKSASAEQIASRTKLDSFQVNRRMKELEIKELIYKNGAVVATKTGRKAYIWLLRHPGQVPEKITEKLMPGESIVDLSKKMGIYTQPDLF